MAASLNEIKKRIERLERELDSLKSDLQDIETGTAGKPEEVQPLPPSKPAAPRIAPGAGKNLELSIGGYVIGIIGAIVVLFAAGWFIKLAIERRWLNESARVAGSILLGYGSIAASWRLAEKKFRIIPNVVFGTGFAILYLALFGGYYLYDLIGANETFTFLFILSITSIFFSRAARSQFLYIFSLVGALCAPILMSQGENSYRFLFSYLTVLNVIFLALSREHQWKTSAFVLLVFTGSIYTGWQQGNLAQSSHIIPILFLAVTFNLYMARTLFVLKMNPSLHPAEYIFIIMNISVFASLGHITVQHLGMSLIPHFYLFAAANVMVWHHFFLKDAAPQTKTAVSSAVILGSTPLVFTAAAYFLDGPWAILCSVSFMGTFSTLASRENRKGKIIASLVLWGILLLAVITPYAAAYHTEHALIFNERFVVYLAGALFLLLTFALRREQKIAWAFGFAALLLMIVATLQENHDFFADDSHIRRLGYSYILVAWAIALLVPGFRRSIAALRYTGLGIIGIVILKFYFYDMWILSQIVRIVAGFTLGLALILMAVFYQKFKERIQKKMFSKMMFLFVALCAIAPAAYAEPVRTASFKYYREINPQKFNIPKDSIYGSITLDDDIYQHSYGYDLRIVHGKGALPSFLSEPVIHERKNSVQPRVIFAKVTREGRAYILELPAIPAGSLFSELHVGVPTGEHFELNLYVIASSDLKEWLDLGSWSLFRYEGASLRTINLGGTAARYLRIESNSEIGLTFPKITYLPKQDTSYLFMVPVNEIGRSYDSDRRGSVFYFDNEKRKKVRQLILELGDQPFMRRYEIQQKVGKRFELLHSGSLHQKKSVKHIIDLYQPVQNPLKLVILNEDNEPLPLKSFSVTGPREILLFRLPGEDSFNLRIYYGNRYASPPRYDIKSTFDRNLEITPLAMGPHTGSKLFSYSMVEPPVSSWIIRILFIAGLCAILRPSYRIIKRYTEETEKKQK